MNNRPLLLYIVSYPPSHLVSGSETKSLFHFAQKQNPAPKAPSNRNSRCHQVKGGTACLVVERPVFSFAPVACTMNHKSSEAIKRHISVTPQTIHVTYQDPFGSTKCRVWVGHLPSRSRLSWHRDSSMRNNRLPRRPPGPQGGVGANHPKRTHKLGRTGLVRSLTLLNTPGRLSSEPPARRASLLPTLACLESDCTSLPVVVADPAEPEPEPEPEPPVSPLTTSAICLCLDRWRSISQRTCMPMTPSWLRASTSCPAPASPLTLKT